LPPNLPACTTSVHPSLPEGRPPWCIATVFWFARVPARHWKYNTFGSSWNVGKGLPTLRLEPVRHSRRHWKYNTHGHAELVVLCMNTALNVLGASVPTLDAQHPMSPDRHLVRSRCYALSVAFEVLRHWKYNPLRLCSRHRCRLARTTSAAYQTILSTLQVQYPPRLLSAVLCRCCRSLPAWFGALQWWTHSLSVQNRRVSAK